MKIKVGSKWSYRPSYWQKYDSYYWYKDNPVVITKIVGKTIHYKAKDEMLGWEEFDEPEKLFLSRFDIGVRKRSKEDVEAIKEMRSSFKKIFGGEIAEREK